MHIHENKSAHGCCNYIEPAPLGCTHTQGFCFVCCFFILCVYIIYLVLRSECDKFVVVFFGGLTYCCWETGNPDASAKINRP